MEDLKQPQGDVIVLPIGDIKPYWRNPRINDHAVPHVAESIRKYGYNQYIVVDINNIIIVGHTRLKALISLGYTEVTVIRAANLAPEAAAQYRLVDNKVAEYSTFDPELLRAELGDINLPEIQTFFNFDLDAFVAENTAAADALMTNGGRSVTPNTFQGGGTGGGEDNKDNEPTGYNKYGREGEGNIQFRKLTDFFVVPPYSILDARQGYWNERKRALKKELGFYAETREQTLSSASLMTQINDGVSLFDLVLLEVIALWFGLEGGTVIDPFNGGYEKPYIFGKYGQSYTGIELRAEQAAINTDKIKEYGLNAVCINDDGRNVAQYAAADSQDLLFSCPPYFDLEVYSDLSNDASNQKTYAEFIAILDTAFTAAAATLKNNRFAVIVVGDVRDKKGAYRRLPDDVKTIFERAGLILYNDIVLIESGGTLALRVGRTMRNRKVGKCHQSVLVFYKGDTGKIQENYPNLLEYEKETEQEAETIILPNGVELDL